ncbi:MAG: hypothetical protein ABFS34_04910 [Gemmatimonadota bacterium]
MRSELLTPDVQKLITYQTQRVGGTVEIAGIVRVIAEDLKQTLTDELEATR